MHHIFFYIILCVYVFVCVIFLGKRWHQDELWEDVKMEKW